MFEEWMMALTHFSWAEIAGIGSVLHLILFLAVAGHCLTHRRDARSTIIWLFSAWSFPIIGPLGYAAFGISRVPRKAWRKHHADSHFRAAMKASEQESHPLAYWRSLREASTDKPPREAELFDGVLDRITPDHSLLSGNRIELLEDGTETFPAMLAAIRTAKHHIHILSYIIGHDEVAREILDACAERARAGIKIRIMYDAFGSMGARLSWFFRRYHGVPNMRIMKFSQVNLFKQQVQINLRNHRKILVIDGLIAFTGGVNLHKGHVGGKGKPAIRDYHFRIGGPLVNELQYTFLRDWYYMTDESPDELLSDVYFGRHPSAGGAVTARLVNCGPTSLENSVEEVFFNAIMAARRDIMVVTPYLVLTEPLMYAMRMTAMRGVEIRLILPAHNNHRSVYYASRAQYEALLTAGVRIFERQGPFVHAKALVVDGFLSIIGTANMDFRSLRLNYETTVVSYDAELATKLSKVMLFEINASCEFHLNLWMKRPSWQRMLENTFSLADPIL